MIYCIERLKKGVICNKSGFCNVPLMKPDWNLSIFFLLVNPKFAFRQLCFKDFRNKEQLLNGSVVVWL